MFYFEKKIASLSEQLFKKASQAHNCILLLLLCAEHWAGEILWDFVGEL